MSIKRVFWLICIGLMLSVPGMAQDGDATPTEGSAGYLAFVAQGEQSADIVVADLATSQVRNLTDNSALSVHPTWSGDGTQIAYNNAFLDADGNITGVDVFVMDANGLNSRNLTSNRAIDVSPDWSPVRDEIVFQSNRDGGNDLYLIDLTSGETRRLTTDGQPKNRPDWSPDGSRVVYWQIEGDVVALKVLDVASGTITTLVDSGQNLWPVWSPDGSQIAVHDESSGQAQIYLVDTATGERNQISDGSAGDFRPEWSPEGAQIAFYSDRAGSLALFVMNANGGDVSLITEEIGADLSASWRPNAPPIDFAANPNLGLSAVRVNAGSVDASEQSLLGGGIRRLYAPRESYYANPVRIRLEIQLDDPDIVPEGEAPAELRDEGVIDVYRIMGAELEGADLEDFTVLPQQNGYLLQIQEDAVNFWDWYLIPNDMNVVGDKFLLVNIYLPDVDDDGVETRTVIESILLQFTITATEDGDNLVEETPEPVVVEPDVEIVYSDTGSRVNLPGEPGDSPIGFTVYNNNRDLLAITLTPGIDFSAMRVASDIADYTLMQTFPSLGAFMGDGLPEDYCMLYERDGETPVRPMACTTSSQIGLLLNPGDIFWYDSLSNSLRDIVIRLGDESYICPAALDRCDF